MMLVVPEPEPETETIVVPAAALHLSARYYPVVVATWFGVLDPSIVDRYGAWLERMGERAAARSERLVIIGDVTGLEARPDPDVRRAMAAAIERLQTRHPGRILGVSTIIGSPVMRAVINMVLAITRQKLDLKPVKDMEQAIVRTLELLEGAGIPRPQGLDATTYQRPTRPR
jgi:hypothetical protein